MMFDILSLIAILVLYPAMCGLIPRLLCSKQTNTKKANGTPSFPISYISCSMENSWQTLFLLSAYLQHQQLLSEVWCAVPAHCRWTHRPCEVKGWFSRQSWCSSHANGKVVTLCLNKHIMLPSYKVSGKLCFCYQDIKAKSSVHF